MVAFRALPLPLSGLPSVLYLALRQNVRQSMDYLAGLLDPEHTFAVRDAFLDAFESREEFGGAIGTRERYAEKENLSTSAARLMTELLGDLWEHLPQDARPLFFFGMHMASFNFNARLALVSDRVFPRPGVVRGSYTAIMLEGRQILRDYLDFFAADIDRRMAEAVAEIERTLADRPHLPDNALRSIVETTDRALGLFGYDSVSALIAAELLRIYDRESERPDRDDEIEAEVESLLRRSLRKHEEYWATLSLDALSEATELARSALEASRPDSPTHPFCLSDYAGCLHERFQRLGDLSDLDQSISLVWSALKATDPRQPFHRSQLNNLGLALSTRFEHGGPATDVDVAVDALEQAVEGTESEEEFRALGRDDPRSWEFVSDRRLIWQTNYANTLRTRFHRRGDRTDLDAAIERFRAVVDATPADSADRAIHYQNLANALHDRFALALDRTDLDQAIELLREASGSGGTSRRDRGVCLGNLGRALIKRWQLDRGVTDLEEATDCLRRAIDSTARTNIAHALQFAVVLGDWCFERRSWDEALDAYRRATALGDELFRLQLGRRGKESWLKNLQGVAGSSAFAACQAASAAAVARRPGILQDAVATLEKGLGRILSERLELGRADLHRLKEIGHGDLFARYELVAARIAELANAEADPPLVQPASGPGQDVESLRAEMERTIEEVRRVPGYADFLQPLTFTRIREAVKGFDLVYLIATPAGGVALLLRDGEEEVVHAIPIEELTEDWVRAGAVSLLVEAETVIDRLAVAIGERLAPLTGALRPGAHLVVVPVGLITLLPLHAAGHADRHLIDVCTVSYAPNVRSLIGRAPASYDRLLALATPEEDLEYAADEVGTIARYFDHSDVLLDRDATPDRLQGRIGEGSALHFSCHARADVLDPLKSAIELHGGELTLADLLRSALGDAALVVLSACESGVPGIELPDEVVNLPSAFLQSGVPWVVSTLWPVGDESAAILMIRFYYLLKAQGLGVPEALTGAQRWVRDTTNGEKHRFLAEQGAARLEASLRRLDSAGRGHDSPWFWAGFTCTGAPALESGDARTPA